MQITFNTDDSLEDLNKIHEILVEAIKKKSAIKVEQPQLQQPKSVFAQPGTGSFAETLKQELSMGLMGQKPVQQQTSQQPKSEVQVINEEYRKQYEENKRNPKPKGQNPEIDMIAIYYAEKRKRF